MSDYWLDQLLCTEPVYGTWWWEQFGVREKQNFPLQNVCVPSRNFVFPCKTFTFSRKDIAFSRKYVYLPLQNFLRSLAKPVEFGQTLPVYFTACSSSAHLKRFLWGRKGLTCRVLHSYSALLILILLIRLLMLYQSFLSGFIFIKFNVCFEMLSHIP